jgi:hypothetical protein
MRIFLSVVGSIALLVGAVALVFPLQLLASKGAAATPATVVWVREVGVNILALGLVAVLVRGHPPSPTLRAFLVGNAVVQWGLFPIELGAWTQGVLTELPGIVPNTVLHAVLGTAFAVLAWRMRSAPPAAGVGSPAA